MAILPENLCETHNLGPATKEWLVTQRLVQPLRRHQILYAGHTEASRGYRFVRHHPKFGQVLACVEGEGVVNVEGRWQACRAGTAYVTPPGTPCAYHIKPKCHWKLVWVLLDEKANFPSLRPHGPVRLVPAPTRGLWHAVQGLCHASTLEATGGFLEQWSSLVARETMRLLAETAQEESAAFRRLWAAVSEDLGADWNLCKMAKMAGMSEETLRRRCIRHFSRPALAHLAFLRLQLAADLLMCTDEAVSSLAIRLGYTDPFAFSTAFRRQFGKPPRDFRRLR